MGIFSCILHRRILGTLAGRHKNSRAAISPAFAAGRRLCEGKVWLVSGPPRPPRPSRPRRPVSCPLPVNRRDCPADRCRYPVPGDDTQGVLAGHTTWFFVTNWCTIPPVALRVPPAPLPGCSSHPPSPPVGPAGIRPPCTSIAPSIGSTSNLWMTAGGTVFNRRLSAIHPPTWDTLPPPITWLAPVECRQRRVGLRFTIRDGCCLPSGGVAPEHDDLAEAHVLENLTIGWPMVSGDRNGASSRADRFDGRTAVLLSCCPAPPRHRSKEAAVPEGGQAPFS